MPLGDGVLAGQDCVTVLVRHRCVDYGRVVRLAPLVVDTVNATFGLGNPHGRVVRLGVGVLRNQGAEGHGSRGAEVTG